MADKSARELLADAQRYMNARLAEPPIGYALLAWFSLPWWKRWCTPMPTSRKH